MTAQALSSEFDLMWDNINSGSAPGVTEYEKSLFLTIAQEEVIKAHADNFDKSERSKRILEKLVKSYSINTTSTDITVTLLDNTLSKLYVLPSDTWLILQESGIVNSKRINIKPINLDEFNTHYYNPFRKPSKRIAWRTEVVGSTGTKYVEILAETALSTYKNRYLMQPTPIITAATTLRGVVYSSVVNPIINSIADNELLDLAVNLAYKAFMDGRLHSQQ
jgi:hypothetical protein